MSKGHYIIPIFVSHRGCPHDCIFCNQKKITGSGGDATAADVVSKIDEYLQTIPYRDSTVEVAFYGGSFTAIPIEQQEELLGAVQEYITKGYINNIRISTRPDCISDEIIQILKINQVKIVELGVQSMDEEVLKTTNRGHTAQDVEYAVKQLKDNGFTVGVQVMVGLPGDTEQKCIETVKRLVALEPDIARIYPALVIRNTYMEQMFLDGAYRPLSLEQAVEICKKLLIIFEENQIEVIRIGLQPTENILEGKEVVAGPFHPSMRQLVVSSRYRDMLAYLFKDIKEESNIEILVNPKEVSDIIGQNKDNISYLKSHYGIKTLKILQSSDIEKQSIMVKNGENTRLLSIKDFNEIMEK